MRSQLFAACTTLLAVTAANAAAQTGTLVLDDGSRMRVEIVEIEGQIARVRLHQPSGARWPRDRAQGLDAYQRRSAAPPSARSVVVPSHVPWTNTGISVTKGQWLRFEPSGEIRLSFNGDDVARAAGAASYRFSDQAPIPTIPAGALIGRVGNGKPFSIGDTTQAFQMPSGGRLYLGVNDDHVPDNSGNFVVKVWEP